MSSHLSSITDVKEEVVCTCITHSLPRARVVRLCDGMHFAIQKVTAMLLLRGINPHYAKLQKVAGDGKYQTFS